MVGSLEKEVLTMIEISFQTLTSYREFGRILFYDGTKDVLKKRSFYSFDVKNIKGSSSSGSSLLKKV